MRWVGFAVGVALVAVATRSVVLTLVVPRASPSRLATFVGRRLVRSFFLFLSDRFQAWAAKDNILAYGGPIALLAILVVWLLLFLVGYALMLWPFNHHQSLASALRQSGSSVFTLGFSASRQPGATAVDLLAGFTGLIVVALEIAYLPALYAAFNRRETLVTLLESRAGAPAWGPEILARHHLVRLTDSLPGLYSDWEHWSADVAESHTTYPVLINFRSPHPLRSWVLALLAVLDAAALHLAFCPAAAPGAARLCLRMGFTCLRDIASAVRLPFDPDPLPTQPIALSYEEFSNGARRLAEIGFPLERTVEEAWPHFRGWRVNYEAAAYLLADATTSAPGPWSGERRRMGTIPPVRPVDRTPDDPQAERHQPGRWMG